LPIKVIREFIRLESAGGILLFGAAVLALIVSNSPFAHYYNHILDLRLGIHLGAFQLDKPLILWINDGFMAVFFLLVGLEIKREIIAGELSSLAQTALPGIAAIGGMLVPALIYVVASHEDLIALHGWAIPTATDIAFALGILTLLGSRIPPALKVFLTALAIFDDIGAIVIIAIFYSKKISLLSLSLALACIFILFILNRARVKRISPYIIVGVIMWVCVLKSGVHATLAGVVLAFMIPMYGHNPKQPSPLKHLEHKLHPWVAFLILPVFSFANAGVSFHGFGLNTFLNPVTLGIVLGLFLGKQIGVFGATWLAIKMKWAKMPTGGNWRNLYGIAVLCGVGFTMSLFIGSLAFNEVGTQYDMLVRCGVIGGSLASGLLGYLFLRFFCSKKEVHYGAN